MKQGIDESFEPHPHIHVLSHFICGSSGGIRYGISRSEAVRCCGPTRSCCSCYLTVSSCLQISMQRDNLHFGNVEHRDLHNLHGLLFHRATALGLTERGAGLSRDGDRPFVLTRSFFAGSQRWGPMWTGDNEATWASLRVSVPMVLASGVAGYPWAGMRLFLPSQERDQKLIPTVCASFSHLCCSFTLRRLSLALASIIIIQVLMWEASSGILIQSYSHAGTSWAHSILSSEGMLTWIPHEGNLGSTESPLPLVLRELPSCVSAIFNSQSTQKSLCPTLEERHRAICLEDVEYSGLTGMLT